MIVAQEVTMDEILKRFRRRAAARANQRYPQPLRQLGCEYARDRIKRGESLAFIAEQLGIAEQTLRNWLEKSSSDFLRVQVRESTQNEPQNEQSETEKLILISPSGYRVEGLDLASVSQLLRVLR